MTQDHLARPPSAEFTLSPVEGRGLLTTVDARGEVCPTPLMMATKALKSAEPGEVVQVLIDYAPSLDTIPPQAKRLGWQVQVDESPGPEWTITLTRPD